MTAYWLIGKRIVEEDQDGKGRAVYGSALIQTLSVTLQLEFGRGFSVDNLENMRNFYLNYANSQSFNVLTSPEVISETLSRKLLIPEFQLSWSHYLMLIAIKDLNERRFYEIESIGNGWSLRELKRQYNAGLYMRLALSTDGEGVMKLSKNGHQLESPVDAIKDPYILEFLNLQERHQFSETELENALVDKLEHFLLELGKGFTFVARQKRLTFGEKHFYIDLVFYNRR